MPLELYVLRAAYTFSNLNYLIFKVSYFIHRNNISENEDFIGTKTPFFIGPHVQLQYDVCFHINCDKILY